MSSFSFDIINCSESYCDLDVDRSIGGSLGVLSLR
jgi:hypothetical protein